MTSRARRAAEATWRARRPGRTTARVRRGGVASAVILAAVILAGGWGNDPAGLAAAVRRDVGRTACGCTASLDSLAARDARRRDALIAGDAATLRRLMAPDAVYTHSNGVVQDRAALLAFIARDDVAYRAIRVDTLAWRLHGCTAVGTGTQTLDLLAFGRPVTARSRFTVVWACRDGGWRCVAYQSTPLGAGRAERGESRAPQRP